LFLYIGKGVKASSDERDTIFVICGRGARGRAHFSGATATHLALKTERED
jgi:hypothetical protein